MDTHTNIHIPRERKLLANVILLELAVNILGKFYNEEPNKICDLMIPAKVLKCARIYDLLSILPLLFLESFTRILFKSLSNCKAL